VGCPTGTRRLTEANEVLCAHTDNVYLEFRVELFARRQNWDNATALQRQLIARATNSRLAAASSKSSA
jgi:hypothetical protein